MTATLNPQDILNAHRARESHCFTGVGDQNLQQPITSPESNARAAAATNFPDAQQIREIQGGAGVGDSNLQQPKLDPHAILRSAAATNFPDAQTVPESHWQPGVGDSNLQQPKIGTETKHHTDAATNFPDAQDQAESHADCGVGDSNLPQPIFPAEANYTPAAATNFPDAQCRTERHGKPGVGDEATETAHGCNESQINHGGLGPILVDYTLQMCADVVDDLEKVKISNENRLRTLTMDGEHGHGMSSDHPDVKRLADIVAALSAAEHQAVLNLQRSMRKHPLGPFVKNSKGIGEKQAARLLASIRDPYWNDLHNRPRKLRELYRFCGMDVVNTSAQKVPASQVSVGAGVAPSKQRGEKVHWSPDARMRLWLIASKCVMVGHGGPYRAVYDEGRAKYADAVHTTECKRCGPKGKPALEGSPLSAAHQHARAIRLICKAILRDLWEESKRIHEGVADEQHS